jgi:Ca2+-transporting ATPase
MFICSFNCSTKSSESPHPSSPVDPVDVKKSCRRVDNGLDVFEGLLDNPWFLGVQAITLLGQIIIVFKGGDAFKTEPLTGAQWGWSIVFGIFVIPTGLAVRCVPDAWVVAAGHALKPLAWPLLNLIRLAKGKKADEKRRREVRRQKAGNVEREGQGPSRDRARQHLRWVHEMLGGKEETQRRPDVALMAVRRGVAARNRVLAGNALEDQPAPLDLFAAVEAAKYNTDGALPGLHVHPETAKDDPILVVTPTLSEEVLARRTTATSQLIPPSQDRRVMQYLDMYRR